MPAYLDHAATGPMRPESVEAMLPFLSDRFANPSGAHRRARDARRAVDEAREELASLVGCAPGDVVFTSGGTESDNLAVFGLGSGDGVAVCSAIEHHAVLDPVASIDGRVVAVDRRGRVMVDELRRVIDHGPVRMVSIMAVNNETGLIQPLAELADVVRAAAPGAVLHSDAVQAFCWTDVARVCAPVDSFSLSAHKFGGPKGVGALIVRSGVPLRAQLLGGGQERERRSGTQNVAGIVAMVVAARCTAVEREVEIARIGALRDRLLDGLLDRIDGVIDTLGPDRSDRVAGIAHVCIPGVESEALLYLLEREDVSASAASSCASGALQSSHVLAAMGIDAELARGSLRLSLGHTTTASDIDDALVVVPAAVERLRNGGL
ncbi:MAG: cysteine desulfurase [Acidimicrobiia bacterium]|nr:cysteine desulfurase [Acidimicrobiia bacterium]